MGGAVKTKVTAGRAREPPRPEDNARNPRKGAKENERPKKGTEARTLNCRKSETARVGGQRRGKDEKPGHFISREKIVHGRRKKKGAVKTDRIGWPQG